MPLKNMLILAVLWCALVIPNALFYLLNKDAGLKRRIHPWWMWGIGTMMMSATLFLERERLTVPYVLLIATINAAFSFYYTKAIFFCDCGTTLFRLYPFHLTIGACKCPAKQSSPGS